MWQWHQDFGTWHRDDEMPEPRAMNSAVFLDEVSYVNCLSGAGRAERIEAVVRARERCSARWAERPSVDRVVDREVTR